MSDLLESKKVEEITKLLEIYAGRHRQELVKLSLQPEDFVQDIFVNLLRRNIEFDLNKVISFESFVFLLGKRHLIDLKRKRNSKSRRGSTYSLDFELDDEGNTFAANVEDDESNFGIMLFELIESISQEQISPNYKLSWRELLEQSLKDTPEEIAEKVGISPSRVKQLQKELQEMI